MGADKAMLPWPPPCAGRLTTTWRPRCSPPRSGLRSIHATQRRRCGQKRSSRRRHRRCMRRIPRPQPQSRKRSIQFPADRIARSFISRLRLRHDHARRLPAIQRLLARASLALLPARAAQDIWAVAPENDGKHGHPLLVSRQLIAHFLEAPATGNAREILHEHAQRVAYISVPESLEKAGLNTPEDYEALAGKAPPAAR